MADEKRAAQPGLLDVFQQGGEFGSEYSEAATAWESVLGEDEENVDSEAEKDRGQKGRKSKFDEEDDSEDDLNPDGEEEDDEESEEDDSEEDEDDEDEDDEDEDDESSKTTDLDPETKVKVKVDGEETEVTLKELQDGYSRTQDYTRKTQAVAEERRKLEEAQEQVLQQQGQWSNALDQLKSRLQASVSGRSEADWQKLKAEDELAYYEERDKEHRIQQRLQAIDQEQQRVQQEFQQQQQKQYQKLVEQEKEKLFDALPDWSDEKVAREEYQQMAEYGKSLGFTEQEINGIVDHRALLILRDAAKFKALAEKRDKGKEKVKVRGKKPLKAGTPSNESPKKARARRSTKRLAKQQNVGAAADWFAENILDE